MPNWKALLAGCTTIVVLGLLVQLAFIFVAVGYTELTRAYPGLTPYARIVSYLLGMGVFFAVMALGGYVTAAVAGSRVVLHAALAAFTVIGLSLLATLSGGSLTLTSLGFLLLGMGFAVVGSLMWQKSNRSDAPP